MADRPGEQGLGKVSVILPVHNGREFVATSVPSACGLPAVAQVIAVDDGSTDGTPDVLRDLAAENPKLTVLADAGQPNRGASHARNLGVRVARTEYVAFLDVDDWYLPNRFDVDVPMLDADTDLAGVYGAVRVTHETAGDVPTEDDSVSRPDAVAPEELFSHMLLGGGVPFCTPSITLRRSVLEQYGMFEEHLALSQDTELWLRLAAVCRLAAGSVDEPVAMVRRHGTNRSRLENPAYRGAGVQCWLSVLRWVRARRLGTWYERRLRRALALAVFGRRPPGRPLRAMAEILGRAGRCVLAEPAAMPHLVVVALRRLLGLPLVPLGLKTGRTPTLEDIACADENGPPPKLGQLL